MDLLTDFRKENLFPLDCLETLFGDCRRAIQGVSERAEPIVGESKKRKIKFVRCFRGKDSSLKISHA